MSAVALLLGAATSVGAATSAGQEVGGGGDSVWASSSSSARWSSGQEITEESTPNSAEETQRWAVSCQRGYGVRGEERR